MNSYQQFNKIGQAEGIRKLGRGYQKKLQNKYDRLRPYSNSKSMSGQTINYEREIKHWYEDRTK